MRKLLSIFLIPSAIVWGACTATEHNADYSEVASAQTVTLTTGGGHTAAVNAVGDAVIFYGWCYQNCTPGTLTMGSQTATRASVSTPGTTVGIDGLHTGQAFIYYILSSTASGNQSITFNVSGGASQTQVSYIDLGLSTGCTLTHHLDSSVGNATGGGTANAPTIAGVTGDVLFNAITTSQHVQPSVNSPWSCPTYSGSGETQTCAFNTTVNGQSYILSAASSSVSSNWTLINSSTGWESIISAFTFTPTYYISAAGSDSNAGTTKATAWLHAPGMPNCSSVCASTFPTGSDVNKAGTSFIFRGGDTWHFGNSSAMPYTGGTWLWEWFGTSTNCDTSDDPNAVRTSCVYVGVDQSWFTGGSWARPIMTNDNPTSTEAVSSCPYPNVGGYLGGYDETMVLTGVTFVWVDNFEWTGQCNADSSQSGNVYIHERVANATITQNIYSNNYFHGFTHLPFSCPGGLCEGNEAFTISIGSTIGPGNVCDGWDSDPTSITCLTPGGGGWLAYDNVWTNQAQMVANGCHDWHDNIWLNYYPSGDGVSHGNEFECNNSAPQNDSNGHSQPTPVYNVWYNNIQAHNNSAADGGIKLQLAVNTTPYYIFNNVLYDQTSGNVLNWGGTGVTLPVGAQYIFNNTFDLPTSGDAASCYSSMTYMNNHIIIEGGTGISSGPCTTSNNTVMSHATARTAGYMANGTGTSGSNSNITCANDTTPCAPTSSGNQTVLAGTNEQAYCSTLLAAADSAGIIVRAGTACRFGTTDGCTYNQTVHAMTCPAQTAIARPASTAWDSGAYQFGGGATAPIVTTTTATAITSSTASSGGTVTSNGGASVTSEGVCYGTSPNPTVICTSNGTATPFTSSLTGLTPGTVYYYQAFATNSAGTGYGGEGYTLTTKVVGPGSLFARNQ